MELIYLSQTEVDSAVEGATASLPITFETVAWNAFSFLYWCRSAVPAVPQTLVFLIRAELRWLYLILNFSGIESVTILEVSLGLFSL